VNFLNLAVLAYLIGSISFAWLAVYWFGPRDPSGKRQDLRHIGSGNCGASNVMRHMGWYWFWAIVALDAGKVALSVWIAGKFGVTGLPGFMVGWVAVLGHCFPLYLMFKRGKGISCTLGLLLATGNYAVLAFALVAMAVTFWLSEKRISAASLAGAASFLFTAPFLDAECSRGFVLLASLIIFAHRDNVVRLWKGTEEPLRQQDMPE